MDFKVAGTRDFVTALQLDTKIDGLPADVLAQALSQAKDARLKILDVMDEAIAEPRSRRARDGTEDHQLRDPDRQDRRGDRPQGQGHQHDHPGDGRRRVGERRRRSSGTVSIGSKDGAAVEEARRRIELILDPPTAELGAVYTGKVVNITKFGAFVNILPGRDGLLHISKLGRGKRIDRVEDVLNLGDEVEVRVDDIDNSGKLSLSLVGDDDGSARRVRLGFRAPARDRDSGERSDVRRGRSGRPAGTATAAARAATVRPSRTTWEETGQGRVRRPRSREAGRSPSGGREGGGGGGARRGGRGGRGGGRRRRASLTPAQPAASRCR